MNYTPLLLSFFLCFLFGCGAAPQEEIPEVDKVMLNSSEPKLSVLNEEIEENPSDPRSYYKRAKVYFEIGNYKEAGADINEAITLDGNKGKYYHLLARIHLAEGKLIHALKAATKASETGEKDADLLLLLTHLYFQNGDTVRANKYLAEAERIVPFHSEVYHFKGLKSLMTKDTSSAILALKKAVDLNALSANSFSKLAEIYSQRGKQDSAMYFLLNGIKAEPQNPLIYIAQGKILKNLGLLTSATKAFETALVFDSAAFPAALELGKIYEKENKLSQAASMYELYLSDKIFDKGSTLALAGIYEKTGEGLKAIPLYKQILSSDSANVVVKASLARLYLRFPEEKKITIVKDTVTFEKQKSQVVEKAEPVKKEDEKNFRMPLIKKEPKKTTAETIPDPKQEPKEESSPKGTSSDTEKEKEINKVELKVIPPVETEPLEEQNEEPSQQERKRRKKKEKERNE